MERTEMKLSCGHIELSRMVQQDLLVPQISSRNLNGETFRGITTGNNTTYYIDIMNL